VLVKFSQTKNYALLVVFFSLDSIVLFESSNSKQKIKRVENLLLSNMLKIQLKILNPCSASVGFTPLSSHVTCWDRGFKSHRSMDVCLLWVFYVVR